MFRPSQSSTGVKYMACTGKFIVNTMRMLITPITTTTKLLKLGLIITIKFTTVTRGLRTKEKLFILRREALG